MVRIRLKRTGRRNRPFYRISVADARAPRDGRTVEDLGTYDPRAQDEAQKCQVNTERARYWLSVGARPSEAVEALLRKKGVFREAPAGKQAGEEAESKQD